MHDDFVTTLRSGSARAAAAMTPRPASFIRARGDQRRRHHAAGWAAIALVTLVGGGAAAYATVGHTGSVAPGYPAAPVGGHPAALAKTLRLGHLVLRVPAAWRLTYQDARGDYTVSTGTCAGAALAGAATGSPCPSFSLIAVAGPANPRRPAAHTYIPGTPYQSAVQARRGCPGKPASGKKAWGQVTPAMPTPMASPGSTPVPRSALAASVAGRTADYRVFRIGCGRAGAGPALNASVSFYFEQRDWYLASPMILIVDEYSTPGLARILASATWR